MVMRSFGRDLVCCYLAGRRRAVCWEESSRCNADKRKKGLVEKEGKRPMGNRYLAKNMERFRASQKRLKYGIPIQITVFPQSHCFHYYYFLPNSGFLGPTNDSHNPGLRQETHIADGQEYIGDVFPDTNFRRSDGTPPLMGATPALDSGAFAQKSQDPPVFVWRSHIPP